MMKAVTGICLQAGSVLFSLLSTGILAYMSSANPSGFSSGVTWFIAMLGRLGHLAFIAGTVLHITVLSDKESPKKARTISIIGLSLAGLVVFVLILGLFAIFGLLAYIVSINGGKG